LGTKTTELHSTMPGCNNWARHRPKFVCRLNARWRHATRRRKTMRRNAAKSPFSGSARFRIPNRTLDDRFFTQTYRHEGTQLEKRCFPLKVSIQKSRAQAEFIQIEPCHRVLTIGIKHKCACRLRVQPTIQASREHMRAWRSIFWKGATTGAIPLLARNPERPPSATPAPPETQAGTTDRFQDLPRARGAKGYSARSRFQNWLPPRDPVRLWSSATLNLGV
jgi:hypothetical protein